MLGRSKENVPRSAQRGTFGSKSGDSLGRNRERLRCNEWHRDLLPLANPEEDLECKGAEDYQRRDRETDRRVEAVGPDRPPAVRVQQGPAQHLALEGRSNLAGHLRVGRICHRLRAQLRVGQSTGDFAQMDPDEAVRVDLSLVAGRQLLATVDVHRRRIGGREGRDRRTVSSREVDLLRRQLRRNLIVNEGVPPEEESRAENQDADEAGLENQHSPPQCLRHFKLPPSKFASWPCAPGVDLILTEWRESGYDQRSPPGGELSL